MTSIRLDQADFGLQQRSSLIRAFPVSMSLRMRATMATLAGFPASRSALYFALRSGLNLIATRAGMWRASRKGFHPPLMKDFSFPLAGLTIVRCQSSEDSPFDATKRRKKNRRA